MCSEIKLCVCVCVLSMMLLTYFGDSWRVTSTVIVQAESPRRASFQNDPDDHWQSDNNHLTVPDQVRVRQRGLLARRCVATVNG